jgi:hypothetical protein
MRTSRDISRSLSTNCFYGAFNYRDADSAIKEENVKALIKVIVCIMIYLCDEKYSANYNIANLPVVKIF